MPWQVLGLLKLLGVSMSLISLFKGLQKGLLKDVLVGAGLTLGSSAVSLTALNVAVGHLKNNLNSISGTILNLMALSGIDVAMSLILGAIVTRHTLQAGKLGLQKLK